MSNLQTKYHFKLDFQKVDQHTGGKWLIHDTKTQEYPSRGSKHDTKESECNMFNPIYSRIISVVKNIQEVVHLQNQNFLVTKSLKCSSKVMDGHKNPNHSHNYHDENHEETEFYQGNSNMST